MNQTDRPCKLHRLYSFDIDRHVASCYCGFVVCSAEFHDALDVIRAHLGRPLDLHELAEAV